MRLSGSRTRYTYIYILVVILLGLILIPIFYMILISMTPTRESWLSLIPSHPTFSVYFKVLKNEKLMRYFMNTWFITGSTVFLVLILASVGGYRLSRFRFRGQNMFLFLMLITQGFAPITLSISYFRIAKILNLYNTYSFLILIYVSMCLPFSTLIMRAFFNALPREIEEAAMIDGCTQIVLLFKIILPLSWPGLIATGLYAFIQSWNQYLYPLLFTSDWTKAPITVYLSTLKGQHITDWNQTMAISLLICFPAIILYLIFHKQFTQGMTGGIK